MELTICPDIINPLERPELITARVEDSLESVINLMSVNHIGATLIVDKDNNLEAILSERDIVRYLANDDSTLANANLADLMTKNPHVLDSSDNILKAFGYCYNGNFRHVPVLDGTKLIGMITVANLYTTVYEQLDQDLKNLYERETFGEEKMKNFVKDYDVYSLDISHTVRDAIKLMKNKDIGTVVVLDNGKLEGVFSERDVIQRVLSKGKTIDDTTLETVITREPKTLSLDDNCNTALDSMIRGHYRHMPILNQSGAVLGVLSMRDIYAHLGDQIERDITLALKERDERFAFGV